MWILFSHGSSESLTAKFPCASKVKASPGQSYQSWSVGKVCGDKHKLPVQNTPRTAPWVLPLSLAPRTAGSGTREFTHMQHYYWKAHEGFVFEMIAFKCLFWSYVMGSSSFQLCTTPVISHGLFVVLLKLVIVCKVMSEVHDFLFFRGSSFLNFNHLGKEGKLS